MGGIAAVAGRGRKPKPTAQRLKNGNAGHRAINHAEPKFGDVKNIDAPDWLPEIAVKMWSHVVPELLEEGVLKATDLHNVECFCMAYARWREAEDEVTLKGITVTTSNGSLAKNPALTAVNEAKKQMIQFGALLGLDPSSRTRLTGGKNTATENPFLKLITGA